MPQITGTPFVMVPLHLIKPHNGKPLPAATLLTWCWLQHHTNRETGLCFPTVNTLAKEIGVSKRAVQKSLAHLETLGSVKVQHRQNRPSLYTLVYAQGEPQFAETVKHSSPPKKKKRKKAKTLPAPKGELQFAKRVNLSSGVNQGSPGGELQFAPIYREEQEEVNKNQLIPPLVPPLEVLVSPGDVVLMYNELFASVKGKHKIRSLSKSSKRFTSLKARIAEQPSELYWRELFETAAKIPGLLGQASGWKKGATLDNFLRPSFADKVLNGEYDEWTGEVTLSGSFHGQEHLSKQMEEMRWRIRQICNERFEAKSPPKEWWQPWRESMELELKSRDAFELMPKCIEFARNTWKKLLVEANNEQGNISPHHALPLQPENR